MATASTRFSASRLDLWMKCPLQAKFKYADRLPGLRSAYMVYGIIVHQVLDEYHSHFDGEQAVERFLDLWDDPAQLGLAIDVWPEGTDYPTFRKNGQECITQYHERQLWDRDRVVASEHRFLVPIGEFELTGVIDLVLERKTGRGQGRCLRIIDHKTGSWVPRKSALNLNIQLTCYDYATRQPEFWMGNGPDFPGLENGEALYELYKDILRVPVWHAIRKGKEVDSRSRQDEDFMRLYRVCQEIHHAETLGVYVPKISDDTCTMCDFTVECGIPIDDSDEEEEV